jgi:RNA polymerase sigma-70 factor (sigma-E family)
MTYAVASGTDVPAFEQYAGGAWPSLYRHAYLLTGNHADASDIAQQTLLKAYQSWSRICRSDSPEAYLRRILTNTFLSDRRPKKRRLEVLTDAPHEYDTAPEKQDGPEDRLSLWPHVKSLPPRQRAVIVLRYYEDLTEREIADTLGCSPGNVKSTAHRALKALRAALGSEGATGRER